MSVGAFAVIKDSAEEKEVDWFIYDMDLMRPNTLCVAPYFKFLHVRWYLSIDLHLSDSTTPEDDAHRLDSTAGGAPFMSLHLEMDDVGLSSYGVMCTFSIKSNGFLYGTRSFRHVFCDQNAKLNILQFYSVQDLFNLVSSCQLIITCNLRHLANLMELTELNVLSDNMKSLVTNGEFSDVTLHVKNKEFKSHRMVLATRSPVFSAMFKNEMLDKQTGVVTVPDCDPDTFKEFLDYLYGGKVENISFRKTCHLYKIAEKYDVKELSGFCVEQLKQNLKTNNICEFVAFADEYNDTNLLAIAHDFFQQNRDFFLTTAGKDFLTENPSLTNKCLLNMS